MRLRASTILAAALLLCLIPAASLAAINSYSQDFEGLGLEDPNALSGDGWIVYGNVFDISMTWVRGYGSFPAPNSAAPSVPSAFCAMAAGEGGDSQGAQQLSVFSDYENTDHDWGYVEANVYREMTVTGADVGTTWYFEFDGKRGNLEGLSSAAAFIKTLDPSSSYALTNFIPVDMTTAPTEWHRHSISITIDAGLVNQIFQVGFMATATGYQGSGVFYDNVVLSTESSLDVSPFRAAGPGLALGTRGNPAIGQASQVLAFTLPRDDRVTVRVYDAGGALVTTLVDGPLGAGAHQVTWRGRDATGRTVASGIYFAEVASGAGRAVAKLSRMR